MKTTLPTGRAVLIALVGGIAIAATAPPAARLWIGLLALAIWIAARNDAREAAADLDVRREVSPRIPLGEWASVTWTVRAGTSGARRVVLTEHVSESVETKSFEPTVTVTPGGLARARGTMRPTRRGLVRLGPGAGLVLGSRGLGWLRVETGPAVEIRVDPPVDSLRRISLDTSRARWQGGRARRLRGVGSEFETLRDYRADDDSRWIDWKASARRRKLTSREYQVDEHQTVFFLLDAGRMMATEDGERSKFDHALGGVLAIGWAAMTRGDNAGLVAFDRRVLAELPPSRGSRQSVRLHEALSRLQPSLVEPDYAQAFAHVTHRLRKRALVLVWTDLVDERVSEELIRAATRASRRHLVVVVTLTDRDLLGRVARVPRSVAAAYENAVAADALLLRDAAIGRLRAGGVRVVDAPADRLAAATVETYLRVRMENRM